MRPTIQDISYLLGFHPYGEELTLNFDEGKADFTFPETVVEKGKTITPKVINSYGGLFMFFCGTMDTIVSDEEHMAFLLYWLNKFIFCSTSQAITKEHIMPAWASFAENF